MKLTQKGQVTVPKTFRDQFGMHQGTEVEFEATADGVLIRPSASRRAKHMAEALDAVRGCADAGLTTDTILKWTRD